MRRRARCQRPHRARPRARRAVSRAATRAGPRVDGFVPGHDRGGVGFEPVGWHGLFGDDSRRGYHTTSSSNVRGTERRWRQSAKRAPAPLRSALPRASTASVRTPTATVAPPPRLYETLSAACLTDLTRDQRHSTNCSLSARYDIEREFSTRLACIELDVKRTPRRERRSGGVACDAAAAARALPASRRGRSLLGRERAFGAISLRPGPSLAGHAVLVGPSRRQTQTGGQFILSVRTSWARTRTRVPSRPTCHLDPSSRPSRSLVCLIHAGHRGQAGRGRRRARPAPDLAGNGRARAPSLRRVLAHASSHARSVRQLRALGDMKLDFAQVEQV